MAENLFLSSSPALLCRGLFGGVEKQLPPPLFNAGLGDSNPVIKPVGSKLEKRLQ